MKKYVRVWANSGRTGVKYCHDFEVKNDNIEETCEKAKRSIRNRRDYYIRYEIITE